MNDVTPGSGELRQDGKVGRDGMLSRYLVDRRPVAVLHLVELVDAANALEPPRGG